MEQYIDQSAPDSIRAFLAAWMEGLDQPLNFTARETFQRI
jgi:hypothetical protein